MQRIGSILAASGFSCLSLTLTKTGFLLGIISAIILIKYFYDTKQKDLLNLQVFFLIAGVVGFYNAV